MKAARGRNRQDRVNRLDRLFDRRELNRRPIGQNGPAFRRKRPGGSVATSADLRWSPGCARIAIRVVSTSCELDRSLSLVRSGEPFHEQGG